jgi:hypothetical protein
VFLGFAARVADNREVAFRATNRCFFTAAWTNNGNLDKPCIHGHPRRSHHHLRFERFHWESTLFA